MFVKIDLFLYSLVMLYCPQALLQPLDDLNDDTTTLVKISEVSNTEITEVNKLEDITEKTLKVTEIIQQIDVKENGQQIINKISDVVINNDPITETIKDTNDDLNNINTARISNNIKSTEDVDNTSLSWRSDKRIKKKISKERRAQNPPVSLRAENTKNSDESSNNTESDDPNIFLVINGENVNNISLDSNGLQIKADILINLKVSDSILLNKLINMTKTPYDIISNLLQINLTNIFLFLNPGNTSNTPMNTVNSRISHNPNINKNKVKKHKIILPTDDDPPIDIRFGSEDNNSITTDKNTNNILHITEKPNKNKDNLLSNILPGPLLDFDLPKIPVDGIFGAAANIFNGFK
ncbi:metacaspase-3-like [Helicoverpa armigera]|uniref:metacaspase-3-like n=1 Tax=Helicoverpa armigera TaxID=29058 RepID=UPI0030837B4F